MTHISLFDYFRHVYVQCLLGVKYNSVHGYRVLQNPNQWEQSLQIWAGCSLDIPL